MVVTQAFIRTTSTLLARAIMILLLSHRAKKKVGSWRNEMAFFVVGVLVLSLLSQLLTLNEFISQELTQDQANDTFIMKSNPLAMHATGEQTLQPVPNPNRTLAIIMGSLRGGEISWQTMASNVLDPSSADLAILIPEDDINAMNSSLYKRAKYKWTFKNYEDWGEAVDLINGTEWNGTGWRKLALEDYDNSASVFGGVEDYSGSGAIIFMIRWFLHNHIKENNLTEKYDHFMVTRSDHYYQCTHNISEFSVGNRNLWIPPGQDYKGRTDRHLIAGSDNVLDALDVFPTFMRSNWVRKKKRMNTEKLLSRVWEEKKMNVNYFDRVMFTTALPTDTTRWAHAEDHVPGVPGLLLKYPVEYGMVQDVCPQIKGDDGKEEDIEE
uniref:Uncharacterized protein n=1 Tax=Chaetoceros debilis TaxID=122233 RepID=A0A7S3QB48_9STRA